MRHFILLLCCMAYAAAADPYAGLEFTDGKARSAADFAQQTVVTVYFCSH